MIDQRTKHRVLAPLCARAHASVRPVSLLHVLLADSLLRFATPRNQSLHQRLPGVLMTHRAVISALTNLLLTIPIDKRHCFTQRFSPTGFILNASDSNCCRPIALARIQVKTYPFSSILRGVVVPRQVYQTSYVEMQADEN